MKYLAVTIIILVLATTPLFAEELPSFASIDRQVGGSPMLPQAMEFAVAMAQQPDNNGEFIIACRVLSLLDNARVAIRINPSSGVDVIQKPSKLRGNARLNKPVDFFITCRRRHNAGDTDGVNIELRYRFPYDAAQDYVTEDPHGRYESESRKAQAKALLEELENSGRKVFTIDRAVLLD